MYHTYRIGTIAEKIVAVKIRLGGTFTPMLRQRAANGRMHDAAPGKLQCSHGITDTQFVVRTEAGHSGVITMVSPWWTREYNFGIIPLGPEQAFSDSELSDDAAGDAHANVPGSFGPDEAWFRFVDGKLTWKRGNVSGAAFLNESYPEIIVSLRLPTGNHGEISFASPLFTAADGTPASVLSVA